MPKLIVRRDGVPDRIVDVEDPVVTIGRSKKSTIWLNDKRASRHHCMIVKEGDAYTIVDKGSSNGTYVNRERITSRELKPGDAIVVGNHVIFFESIPENAAEHEEFARKEGKDETAAPIASEGIGKKPEYVLEVVEGPEAGKRFPLTDETLTIGRNKLNRIVIEDPLVSNYHAEVRKEGQGFFIHDLGSTNGTRVNGEKVVKAPLLPGMEVKIGDTRLVLKNLGAPGPLEAMRPRSEPTVAVEVKKLERKKKGLLISFAAVIAVAAAVAIAAFHLRPTPTETPAPSGAAPTAKPLNLLAANPSFEGAVAGDATPEGWKFEVAPTLNVFVDDTRASDGKKSLAFKNLSAEAATAPNAVVMKESTPVKGGKSYRLRGMIMTEGAIGFNAFRARAFNSRKPAMYVDYYTSPVSRTHTDFVPSECSFTVPSWADRLSVACVTMAEKGNIWFDDVALSPVSPIPAFFVTLTFPLSPYRFVLDRTGNFWTLDDAGVPVLVSRGVVLDLEGGRSPIMQPLQGRPPVLGGSRRTGKAEATLSLFDVSSNADIPMKVAAGTAEGKCSLVFRAGFRSGLKLGEGRLTFALNPDALGGTVSLAAGGGIESAEPPLKKEGVSELILGSGGKILSVAFPSPAAVELRREGGVLLASVSGGTGSAGEFTLAALLGHESPALEAYLKAEMNAAREMLKTGNMLEGLKRLERLKERFPDDSYVKREADRAAAEVERRLKEFSEKIDELLASIREAAEEENAALFESGTRELEELAKKIAIRAPGSDADRKAREARGKAEALAGDMKRLIRERKAARLLDMAKRAFADGKPLLSLVYLENLMSGYHDTEAARLSKELRKKVEARIEELKAAADEWYELEAKLREQVKRGSRKAVRKAVEDFLRKHPGFAPAKKFLDSLD